MPDPLEDLLSDLYEKAATAIAWHIDTDDSALANSANTIAADFLDLLKAASGEQRRNLLEAMGYEVSQGYAPSSWDGTVEMGFSPDALFDTDVPILVLRDERETTRPEPTFDGERRGGADPWPRDQRETTDE